jgi:hypothetical protein
MLSRIRQIAAKIETTEGTAESLAAADAALLAYDPKINFDVEMFERNPARESLSRLSKISGKRPASFTFRILMRGSGTAATAPGWGKLLKACGFNESTLKSINIGAITNGPFQHGETITGGTSAATGRVVIKTANGAAAIWFVTLTGTFQSGEVITGGTSGATATTSSTPSNIGIEYKPLTLNAAFTNVPSLTMAGYEQGLRKLLKGCRGKVGFNFTGGQPAAMEFEFMGVEAGVADVAMLSGISYGTTIPPAFLSAAFSINAYSAKVGELKLDVNNTMAAREDVNESRGILSYIIGDRVVNGSFNPEMVLAATHDFHTLWFNNTEMILDFTVGSASGNKFRFYGSKAQYTKIDDEDRDGIKIARATFDLNGTDTPGDDELTILHL